jgi:PAS domain S-box-containing protein
MKLRMNSMTTGLAVGITLAVAVACGAGSYFYSLHHYQSLLETARGSALAQGELIRVALEHQMMENDRSLIDKMIRRFGTEPGVESVMLLDRDGRVAFASKPPGEGADLTIGSPTCQACHRHPPEQRAASRVIETPLGSVLRSVVPIRNQERCHGCHDPARRINGILIVDLDAASIRASLHRDLRWMAAGSGAVMLVLIGAIGSVVRIVVMRRLQRFETTARKIAAGDLEQRVPEGGSDTVAWLAREFNAMADSTTGLLQEVRDQQERLETVINSIDDAIVVLDPERRVIASNDAFLQRTGRERHEVLGSSCAHVTSGMCGPTDCPTLACLRTGERQIRICERQVAGGGTVVEEVHTSPIRDPSGKIVQVVEVWRDISKRRGAEAQLAEAHRLASLGMLASGFSHELNTPLATVLTCVEGILRSLPGEEPEGGAKEDPDGQPRTQIDRERIQEHARIAREQLLRCRGITQHFLHLSSGRSSPTEIVDAGAALAAVARLITPTARTASVRIEMADVPPGLQVRVNDADLQHMLLNLVLNAVQASPADGRVRLEAEGGESVRIRISDEGCGISLEEQKRIFEPFHSLRPGGTGLGLFLTLNLARRWGGNVGVQSAPGHGSTFEVTLPGVTAETDRRTSSC